MRDQRTNFSQKDFLLKVYLISIAAVGFYLSMAAFVGAPLIKVLLLSILGIAFLAGYIFTVRSKRLAVSSHYYISCLYIIMFANAGVAGGIGAPGTIWFALCPLVAFITLSTRIARVWLIVIVATIIGFFIFEETVVLEKFEGRKVWYLVSYLLFFPVLFSILKIFRKEVSKRNTALTTLNQRLVVERKMLQKSQDELLQKSESLKQAESKALERSAKLSYYLDQLIEVKRMEELHSGGLHYSIQSISQFLVRAMDLDNVAVWQAQPDTHCLELFRYHGNTVDVFERSLIYRRDFPDAYDMLATGAIVVGHVSSKESEQLKTLFLCSPGTDSMINCPFFVDGKFAGFISCRATQRRWLHEDLIFVRAISDTIPLAFKSNERRMEQDLLQAKQREITEINASLERKVKERTMLLNERNKQLTDFAFTNAHHIRGPICRLLGLHNLLIVTNDTEEIRQIANYINLSVDELDEITRKTSAHLNVLLEEVQ
jgi:hypothetical protein